MGIHSAMTRSLVVLAVLLCTASAQEVPTPGTNGTVAVDGAESALPFNQRAPTVKEVVDFENRRKSAASSSCTVGQRVSISNEGSNVHGVVVKCGIGNTADVKLDNGNVVFGATLPSDNDDTPAGDTKPTAKGELVQNAKIAKRQNGTGMPVDVAPSPLHMEASVAIGVKNIVDMANRFPDSREAAILRSLEEKHGKAVLGQVVHKAYDIVAGDEAAYVKQVEKIRIRQQDMREEQKAIGFEQRELSAVEALQEQLQKEIAILESARANETAAASKVDSIEQKTRSMLKRDALRAALNDNFTQSKLAAEDAKQNALDAEMAADDCTANSSTVDPLVTNATQVVDDFKALVAAKKAEIQASTDSRNLKEELFELEVQLAHAHDNVTKAEELVAAKRSAKAAKCKKLRAEAIKANEKADAASEKKNEIQDKLESHEHENVSAVKKEKSVKEAQLLSDKKYSDLANAQLKSAKTKVGDVLHAIEQGTSFEEVKQLCKNERTTFDEEQSKAMSAQANVDIALQSLESTRQEISLRKAAKQSDEKAGIKSSAAAADAIAKLEELMMEQEHALLDAKMLARTAEGRSTARHIAALSQKSSSPEVTGFHTQMRRVLDEWERAFHKAHAASLAYAESRAALVGMETKVNDAEVASREKERALFESLKQASESAKSEHSDASNATTMAEMQVNFTKSLLAKAKGESQSSKVKATTLADKIQSLEEEQQASQDKKAALKREASLAKMENNTALLKSKKEEIKRIDADLKALDAKIAANKEDKAAAEKKTKELDETQRRLKLASVFMKSFKPLLGNISKVANKSAILFNESHLMQPRCSRTRWG